MKKLLSLTLCVLMLSAMFVTSLADADVSRSFKDDATGITYFFGKFDAGASDAGIVLNGDKKSLLGGGYFGEYANAFLHASAKNNLFGIGIKPSDSYLDSTVTVAPYETFGEQDFVGETQTVSLVSQPEASITGIAINGVNIPLSDFDENNNYSFRIPDNLSGIPEVSATASWALAPITVSQATAENPTATVSFGEETYTVEFVTEPAGAKTAAVYDMLTDFKSVNNYSTADFSLYESAKNKYMYIGKYTPNSAGAVNSNKNATTSVGLMELNFEQASAASALNSYANGDIFLQLKEWTISFASSALVSIYDASSVFPGGISEVTADDIQIKSETNKISSIVTDANRVDTVNMVYGKNAGWDASWNITKLVRKMQNEGKTKCVIAFNVDSYQRLTPAEQKAYNPGYNVAQYDMTRLWFNNRSATYAKITFYKEIVVPKLSGIAIDGVNIPFSKFDSNKSYTYNVSYYGRENIPEVTATVTAGDTQPTVTQATAENPTATVTFGKDTYTINFNIKDTAPAWLTFKSNFVQYAQSVDPYSPSTTYALRTSDGSTATQAQTFCFGAYNSGNTAASNSYRCATNSVQLVQLDLTKITKYDDTKPVFITSDNYQIGYAKNAVVSIYDANAIYPSGIENVTSDDIQSRSATSKIDLITTDSNRIASAGLFKNRTETHTYWDVSEYIKQCIAEGKTTCVIAFAVDSYTGFTDAEKAEITAYNPNAYDCARIYLYRSGAAQLRLLYN